MSGWRGSRPSKGYRATLSLDNVVIQSVPNMASNAPFVREGFVTATSKLTVVCREENRCEAKTKPKSKAKLNMSAQVGCPLDVSSGMSPQLEPSLNSSLPVGAFLGAILPPPTPAPDPVPTDVTDIALSPNGKISPQVGVEPLPGYIRDISLGHVPSEETQEDTLTDPPLRVSVQNLHMEVDNVENALGSCGGNVAVRIYVHALIDTDESLETIDIYGDLYTL